MCRTFRRIKAVEGAPAFMTLNLVELDEVGEFVLYGRILAM